MAPRHGQPSQGDVAPPPGRAAIGTGTARLLPRSVVRARSSAEGGPMPDQRTFEVVAARLASYLPPGATEAECAIPVAAIGDWLRAAGAPPLPPEARERAWWADLGERRDYPALPDAAWRVERIDWE